MKNFKPRNNDRQKSYDKKPDFKHYKQKSYTPKYESNSFEKKSYGPVSAPSMHAATCSECGNKCEVPFRPSGDKPVFCLNCFAQKRLAGRGDMSDRRPNKDFGRLKSKRDTPSSMNIKHIDHSEEIRIMRAEITTLHSKIEAVTIMITEMKTRELKVVELKDEVIKPTKKLEVREVKVKAEKVKPEKVKEVKVKEVKANAKEKEVADKKVKKVPAKKAIAKVAVKAPTAKKVATKKATTKKGK